MTLDPAGLEAAAKVLCPVVVWDSRDAQLVRTYTAQATDAVRAYLAASPVPPDGEPNAAEVLSLIYVMLTGAEPMWAEMPADERCARAANEAQQAFLAIEAAAAGRAAATPDPPTDERRPWPIAPDTVMPPRRQPVRWGSRADDPPTEIHDDPGKTKAYLAGLAAGRTEAAAASPDERLRQRLAGLDTVEVQESALDDPETFVRKADLDAALAEAPGSPDERLREAGEQLANLVTLLAGSDGPGYFAAPNQGERPDYYATAKLFDRIMRDEKTGAAIVLAEWRAALAAADREAPAASLSPDAKENTE